MSKDLNGDWILDGQDSKEVSVAGEYKLSIQANSNYGILECLQDDGGGGLTGLIFSSHTQTNGMLNNDPYRNIYTDVITDKEQTPILLDNEHQTVDINIHTEPLRWLVMYNTNLFGGSQPNDELLWCPNYIDVALKDNNEPRDIFRDPVPFEQSLWPGDPNEQASPGYPARLDGNIHDMTQGYPIGDIIYHIYAKEYPQEWIDHGIIPQDKQFSHWNTEPDDSGIVIQPNEKILPLLDFQLDHDLILYAIYEELPRYNANLNYDEFEIDPNNVSLL